MKKMEFSTIIEASPRNVWDAMFRVESSRKWIDVSWPGCYFEGNWKEGEHIKFLSPNGTGRECLVIVNRPYEYVLARHVAVVKKDGSRDRESKEAKSWIGTTLGYSFRKKDSHTQLTVEMTITPEWEEQFSKGWPNALEELKKICGRSEVKQ
jgi:hypothetical protein